MLSSVGRTLDGGRHPCGTKRAGISGRGVRVRLNFITSPKPIAAADLAAVKAFLDVKSTEPARLSCGVRQCVGHINRSPTAALRLPDCFGPSTSLTRVAVKKSEQSFAI